MYVIIWEYRVKPERVADFETVYGKHGSWAELFQQANGYLGTELLHDSGDPHHYMTIDRWTSVTAYDAFLSDWEKEYKKLDTQCEGLTEQEDLFGRWESISSETR